jgi:hypothetical protein
MTSEPVDASADDVSQSSNESTESEQPSPFIRPEDRDTWKTAKKYTSGIGTDRLTQLVYLIMKFNPHLTEKEVGFLETLINPTRPRAETNPSTSSQETSKETPPKKEHRREENQSVSQRPDEPEGPNGPNPPTSHGSPDEFDGRFRDAWIGFVKSIRSLINSSIADLPRFTDQFRQWAAQVLKVAESAAVADKLQEAYIATERQLRELLLIELLGINEAVEVARQTEPGEKWPSARKTLLGVCGTAIDSLKDIFSDFLDKNPLVKGILTLLGEVVGLFRGN